MDVSTFDVMETFGADGKTKMLKSFPAMHQCVRVILLTERGELFGDPSFGMNFRDFQYKLNTYVIRDLVSDEITRSILRFDDRILTVNNTITPVEAAANILVQYSVGNEVSDLTLTIEEGV